MTIKRKIERELDRACNTLLRAANGEEVTIPELQRAVAVGMIKGGFVGELVKLHAAREIVNRTEEESAANRYHQGLIDLSSTTTAI